MQGMMVMNDDLYKITLIKLVMAFYFSWSVMIYAVLSLNLNAYTLVLSFGLPLCLLLGKDFIDVVLVKVDVRKQFYRFMLTDLLITFLSLYVLNILWLAKILSVVLVVRLGMSISQNYPLSESPD